MHWRPPGPIGRLCSKAAGCLGVFPLVFGGVGPPWNIPGGVLQKKLDAPAGGCRRITVKKPVRQKPHGSKHLIGHQPVTGGQGNFKRRDTTRHKKIHPNPVTIQKLRRRISSPVINSQARDSRLASVATMAVMTRTRFQPRAEESRKNTKISAVPRRILVISRSNSRYRFLFPTLHPSGGHFSTGILSQSVRNCNRFDRIR